MGFDGLSRGRIVGKTEIIKTLGTKNLEDAKRANRRVADEVDARFEQARAFCDQTGS